LTIVLYIVISNVVMIALTHIFFFTKDIGSDHPLHVSLIRKIRNNNHHFCSNSPFQANEKNFCYPQLFHWIISYLPEKIYTQKHDLINLIIRITDAVFFNLFLFYICREFHLPGRIFLLANIFFYLNPMTYATWNAKNLGLSPRGLSLVTGQIYTYLMMIYQISGSNFLLLPIFGVIFVSLLLSQFTFQYILLSLPFYAIFFQTYVILTLPIFAAGLYLLLFREIAISFFVGQYHHKRNYFLYLAEIFILPPRPSIYLDFFTTFREKFKRNKLWAFIYIYQNPLVEVVLGIPYLLYIVIGYSGLKHNMAVFQIAIFIALLIFILTSFRKTRFLGEPQRYLEFVIPLVTILFAANSSLLNMVLLGGGAIIIIQINRYLRIRNISNNPTINPKTDLFEYIKSRKDLSETIATSNDNDLLKFFPIYNLAVLKPELTCFYENKKTFTDNFHQSYFILKPETVVSYLKDYQVKLLVMNSSLYSAHDLDYVRNNLSEYELTKEFGDYEVYEKCCQIDERSDNPLSG